MTIEQAIEVIRKLFNAQGIDALTREELDALTMAIRSIEAWQKVIDEIKKEKEDAMFKPNSDFCDGVFYALGFTLGVIDKELGEVGETDEN